MSKLWGYLGAALAGLGTILAMLVGARKSGRNKERADNLEHELEESEANHVIKDRQLDAAADRPRDRDGVRDRLRSGRF